MNGRCGLARLDAIEASTAAATKKAYRSDWQRFAAWAGRRRFPPLPAAPVVAHYVTEAAAEQTGIGRWRYAPRPRPAGSRGAQPSTRCGGVRNRRSWSSGKELDRYLTG